MDNYYIYIMTSKAGDNARKATRKERPRGDQLLWKVAPYYYNKAKAQTKSRDILRIFRCLLYMRPEGLAPCMINLY